MYEVKEKNSVGYYTTKLLTGIGGDGSYQISGRPYDSEPELYVNYSSNDSLDYINGPITVSGATVSPMFVYFGKDISDLGAVATVGENLAPNGGTGSWTNGLISQIPCPAGGPDYTAAYLCTNGNSVNGMLACTNTNFGNTSGADLIVEGLVRPAQMASTGAIFGKWNGASTPTNGNGWYVGHIHGTSFGMRLRCSGAALTGPAYSCYPGQWIHFLITMEMGGKANLYINGIPGGSTGINCNASIDSTYPLVLGSVYSATAPTRTTQAVAFIAGWSKAGWLDGANYDAYALERYALVYDRKLSASNSSIVYSFVRNFPVVNASTGNIYSVNTVSSDQNRVFFSDAKQNLLGTSIVWPGSNWDCNYTQTAFVVSYGLGPMNIAGQTNDLLANAAVSGVVEWSSNFTGYTSGGNGCVSFWAKDSLCKDLKVSIHDDATNVHTVWVNVNATTIINASANVTATITNALGGWRRVAIVKPNLGTGNKLVMNPAQAGNTTVTVANNGKMLSFWGIMVADGGSPLTDVPITKGGPCNAYVEYLQYSHQGMIGSGGGTVRVEALQVATDPVNTSIVSCYESVNSSNHISFNINTDGNTNVVINGNEYANLGDIGDYTVHPITAAYFVNNIITSVDGSYTQAAGPESMPDGIDTLKITGSVRSVKTYIHATTGV